MDRYKILLHGEHFLLNLDGEHARVGFYATRIVKSDSAADAERIAVIRIHQELNLNRHIVKSIPVPPSVMVEKIEKMGTFQFVRKQKLRGLIFHKEEEATADQNPQC